MAQFYTLLTQTGQAKMANAIALGTMIEITALAVGDGGGNLPVPDSSRTTLVNEVRRAPINRVEVDADNPNWLIVEQVLPPDVGGWTIREVGVIDADGDLIGYGNYPETYKPTLDEGSGRTQTIRMVLEVSATSAVTLKVDPSVVLATREYVDDHAASRDHPDATTTDKGFVRKATSAEAKARASTIPVVTPAGLGAALTDHEQATEAHNASQIALAAALANFVDAENVQAVLAALGSAAKLGKADNVQAQNYQNATHALTPASLIAGVLGEGTVATNAYLKIPYRDAATGELKRRIIQWGYYGGGLNDPLINFPIAFPSSVLHLHAMAISNGNEAEYVHTAYPVLTGFRGACYRIPLLQGYINSAADVPFFWIAMGE